MSYNFTILFWHAVWVQPNHQLTEIDHFLKHFWKDLRYMAALNNIYRNLVELATTIYRVNVLLVGRPPRKRSLMKLYPFGAVVKLHVPITEWKMQGILPLHSMYWGNSFFFIYSHPTKALFSEILPLYSLNLLIILIISHFLPFAVLKTNPPVLSHGKGQGLY